MPEIRTWQVGRVDRSKEHFELRYGSAENQGWDDWVPTALVGPPVQGITSVEFLLDPQNPSNADVLERTKKEVQFYLIDLGEPDPWEYSKYHCGTVSNAYSSIHWSFFKSLSEPSLNE